MGVNVQAQGLKLRTKTLEDVLKSTYKTEPKLIGFDETPIDVKDTTTIEQVMVNGDLCNKSNAEICPIRDVSDASSSCVIRVAHLLQSSSKGKLSETVQNRDCGSDLARTGNIKTVVVLLCQILEPAPLFH
jgi:hypothetical protein